ncbi:MAG: methyltransferase domain-containing protein [Parachlamydiales bacterium]|nr:methyltransferase domain-containing protein [Parachlamydiales bacterium]
MNNIDLEKTLFDEIKKLLENLSLKELRNINLGLTKRYKERVHNKFLSDSQRLAYITSRMPSTFKALLKALQEMVKIAPEIKIQTVLDLGSGPGTSVWSLFSIFEDILKINLIEKDAKLVEYAKVLTKNLPFENKLHFEINDLLKIKNYDSDLVILSYVANELKDYALDKIVNNWFKSESSKVILFIEPGTKYGFKSINYVRDRLIDKGASMIAPCPNELKCPMKKNDWCHFYVRVKRTKQHQYIKNATLAYEDEKFSYVIASKDPVRKPNSRVLRYPKTSKTEVNLVLCKEGQIKQESIYIKDRKNFKIAKKLDWGDSFI